jgi:phosphoglycerol transferase MdoB-like AlkP superfamily enzyme
MNQSVMNGVLNLYKTSQIIPPSSPLNKFIDAETATAFVEKNLGFNYINNEYILENDISNKNLETSANVVLILIESFSKNYLDIKVGNNDLMPFTNNLKDKSFYLNSFYSQATRTNQGILATLYGFPAIFERHMLRNLNIDTYEEFDLLKKDDPNSGSLYTGVPSLKGLPQDLKSRGYNTLFFMNHNPKFDNLNNFLPQNGFNQIYSLDDYPASESVNIWGVSDDYLLNYSLAKLDSASASKQPFFATILTISNHIPYAIDPNFNKVSDNEDENAMAYVDMCIANFMNSAAQKEWYSNTIFVIVGDHGKVLKAKNEYGIPLSLNHIPLIIHSPLFKESKVVEDVAGQIDLYPTIIGLLGSSPIHKSFGIDVINNKRDNIFFPVDDKLVCVNKTHLHIYDTSLKTSSLYEWGDVQFKNIINENKVIADHMKTYSTSMMEAAKYIFNNNLIK